MWTVKYNALRGNCIELFQAHDALQQEHWELQQEFEELQRAFWQERTAGLDAFDACGMSYKSLYDCEQMDTARLKRESSDLRKEILSLKEAPKGKSEPNGSETTGEPEYFNMSNDSDDDSDSVTILGSVG